MTTQPTQHMPLPKRPTPDPRRASLLSALALAEYLVGLGDPMPSDIKLQSGRHGSIAVDIHLYNSVEAVHAYRDRFGGTISQVLRLPSAFSARTTLYTALSGVAYDGEFIVWTITDLTAQEFAARFIAEHGEPADWAEKTAAEYRAAVAKCRPAVAQ